MADNPERLLNQNIYFYTDGKILFKRDGWGDYQVKGDTLLIQYFFLDGGSGFFYRNVFEVVGTINDESVTLYREACDWCGNRLPHGFVYTPPSVFVFRKTDDKPDSTTSFFYRRKWYNKGLSKRLAR